MSDNQSKEINFEELRFIRVFTPSHIPKELIEQVKNRTYDVDEWYKYQEVVCLRQTDSGPQLNPLSMLYAIADNGNRVVGVLWCEVVPLENSLVIQTFSMDKKYWVRGKAVSLLADKAKEIVRECKLKTIYWFTNYPKHSEKYGFKRSKSVLMEFMGERDGKGTNGREYNKSVSDDVSRTAAVIIAGDRGSGAGDESTPPAIAAAV